MKLDPSLATICTNAHCVMRCPCEQGSLCSVSRWPSSENTSFLQVLLIPRNPHRPWTQDACSASRGCWIPGGRVKAGATYTGRNSPCICPRHPPILWSMKKRCHSDILNQYQMLLSKRRKTGRKKKKKQGLLLKICSLHWWRNAVPKVKYVCFYTHWRKKQSHSFPCSVSDQHKYTRAQVHFYPLEKFSLIRTDTVLSQSNINVQAQNLINPLLTIFAACSDIPEGKKKEWERLKPTTFQTAGDFSFLPFFPQRMTNTSETLFSFSESAKHCL